MRRFGPTLLLFLGSAVLAACATATPTPAVSSSAPEPSGQMTADWSRIESVSLTLSDFHFTPNQLELRQDTPYRLHLVNASTSAHSTTESASSSSTCGLTLMVNRSNGRKKGTSNAQHSCHKIV